MLFAASLSLCLSSTAALAQLPAAGAGDGGSQPHAAPDGELAAEPTPPEEPERRETMVTATRIPIESSASPRAGSVVSARELELRPPRTTPEALLEEEGVFLQKTSHAGGAPIVRGLIGQQVLVVVDGVRLNNATTRSGPNQHLNTVDPFLVERMELVRGPGSVLYGSDALGGVVSVFTLRPRFSNGPTDRGAYVLARGLASSADTGLQGHLRAGMAMPDTAVLGAATGREFGELSNGREPQRYTGYEELDGALKVRQRLYPGAQLLLQYQAARQSGAPRTDRSFPGDFRLFTLQERDFAHGKLEFTAVGPFRELEVDASALRQSERLERWVVARDRHEREDTTDWTFGLRAEAKAALPLELEGVVGFEGFYDWVDSQALRRSILESGPFSQRTQDDRYPGRPTALSSALFGLVSSDATRPLSYHGGLRAQLNLARLPEDDRLAVQFSKAVSPPPVFPASTERALGLAAEAGVQQRLFGGVALLANAGIGFRAPNVDDYLRLGSEGPGFAVPSRGLSPERSLTLELGSRLSREQLEGQLFGSYTFIDSLIASTPAEVAAETTTPDGQRYLARVNAESATVAAVEASVAYRPHRFLTFAAHATYTHSRQRRRDLTVPEEAFVTEALPKTPPLNGLVRAALELEQGLFLEISFRWAAPQRDIPVADRGDLRICPEAPGCVGSPGFGVVHARAGAKVGRHLAVTASVQNIGNALYRQHGSGVDEPGFSGVVGMEVSL
ncbi:MAG: TonB-dependent receptor [Myxococcales bacterium]|nr:TonB-dependent receptor [Myxococcales bacterium]